VLSTLVCVVLPVGERRMPQTEQQTNTQTALDHLLALGYKVTVQDPDTKQTMVVEAPAATATPTKRKPKANEFYNEVIVGGYAKREMRRAWKATKGENMKGVSLSVAQANGWASKRTGRVTKKGKSAKPKRTVSWA